jgi:hypothetical protein
VVVGGEQPRDGDVDDLILMYSPSKHGLSFTSLSDNLHPTS